MSNKTEIQALNAKYESLIESLRSKAVGGGVSTHTTGVYIPASTTGTIKIEHGLGKIPHFFSIVPRELGVVAADSSSVFLAGVFTKVHDSAPALHTTFRPSSGNLLAFGSQSTSAAPSWGLTAVDENYATIKCYSGMPFQLTFNYEWHAIRYD